jgi:hypothetical protein
MEREPALGIAELEAGEAEVGDEGADRPRPAFFSMTRAISR